MDADWSLILWDNCLHLQSSPAVNSLYQYCNSKQVLDQHVNNIANWQKNINYNMQFVYLYLELQQPFFFYDGPPHRMAFYMPTVW